MNNKGLTITAIGGVLIAVLALIISLNQKGPSQSFGTTDIALNVPMTSGSALCGTSPTLLVATSSSGRNFMTISNISTQFIYLGFGYSATLYKGTAVAASTTLTLDSTKSYTGAIYCISATGSASTTWSDSNS